MTKHCKIKDAVMLRARVHACGRLLPALVAIAAIVSTAAGQTGDEGRDAYPRFSAKESSGTTSHAGLGGFASRPATPSSSYGREANADLRPTVEASGGTPNRFAPPAAPSPFTRRPPAGNEASPQRPLAAVLQESDPLSRPASLNGPGGGSVSSHDSIHAAAYEPRRLEPTDAVAASSAAAASDAADTEPAAFPALPLPKQKNKPAAGKTSRVASPYQALVTVGLATVAVVGLFLGLAYLARRGLPSRGGLLSSDVVTVLGRAPLAGKQLMFLIRIGNRLLLVSSGPDGVSTLTEITDPEQVLHLSALVERTKPTGATVGFRDILRDAGKEKPREARTAKRKSILGAA
jgi:flagellar biogenesis protein FliO